MLIDFHQTNNTKLDFKKNNFFCNYGWKLIKY